MAAVSEQTRVNFNPEWMGSTYSASSKLGHGAGGGGLATSPPFGSGGAANMNVYCGGSAANNADGNILAPPKLAKNRYGREEMLALFTGPATVAPAELKTTFPEFYIEQQQEPICMMPFTDVEERLLIQGGINSSKVINVVNHAERMRYGPPRSFGRGAGMEPTPGGQSPEILQQPAPPFVRPTGYTGVGRGMPRGPYPGPPGGFDQMTRPPGRFGMLGRGRGDGGRGRGFDRLSGGPGGFGGPPPFAQPGVRFSENVGGGGGGSGGGQNQNEEDWAPQNTRAQGLYDPNDPRDRPRQRQKSTSRTDDMDDPAGGGYQPGQLRNAVSQRRSYTAPIGQAVPEWMDDDDAMDDSVVGSFDATGQFQAASGDVTTTAKDSSQETTKKPSADAKQSDSASAPTTPASADVSAKTASQAASNSGQKAALESQPSADKGSKIVGKSIPVESLFSSQPATKPDQPSQPFRDNTAANAGLANQQKEGRRLPKAFAGLGQQEQPKETTSGVAADSSGASMDIGKLLGQQKPVPAYSVQQQQQQQNVQGQPKFVVPKTISSSSDEVFTQLHEDVESLVNSFSADDMPSVVRNKKGNTENAIPQQPQPQHVAFRTSASTGGKLNVQQQSAPMTQLRSVSASITPQLERSDSVNVNRNSMVGQQWYYTDPQGGLRGPFESTQMAGWFAAGYFTMQLLVRRAEDTDFVPLGDLIKQCGRIPFVTSTCSSTADTPSPNPVSAAASSLSGGQSVVQPAARYGVAAASMAASQNVPSNILGALTNHTGGGAFHKTTSAHAMKTPSATSGGGLWDMEFSSSQMGADQLGSNKAEGPVTPDIQQQLNILNQMLKKEREEEIKRRADEEERQRKMMEAREAARREEERQKALLKEKEEELRRLQDQKAEMERRRKEEEEARRLKEKKMLEEQQRRLEELAKVEAEERRKRAAEEERLRKEREAKEAAERKKREEEEKRVAAAAAAAAAALKQQQEEQLRLEQQRKKQQQQQKKAAAAPWAASAQQPTPHQSKNGVQPGAKESSLMDIQKEELRQFEAERRQEMEIEMQRKQNLAAANVQFGSAWGGAGAASKLKWEQSAPKQSSGQSGPAWGGKGEVQVVGSHGLWDDDDSPPASPQKSKNQKTSQTAKTNSKAANQTKASSPPVAISAKKEQNVKRIFQSQQSASDEFTNWCVKQVNGLSSDIDALTFVSFLKEVEAPSEVEDYVVSYFGDSRPAREFTRQFLEKRNGLRKSAAASKNQADDLSTPAPALNPMKSENVAPNASEKSSGAAGGANKKKKSGKSAGRFVDCSILGFKATADPNRLNAGEIDNPM